MERPSHGSDKDHVKNLFLRGAKRVEPAEEVCQLCNGLGMRVLEDTRGRRSAQTCDCRAVSREERDRRVLVRSGLPERYMDCSLNNYQTSFAGAHSSLFGALLTARNFVASYPHRIQGLGLLFTGSVGTGKTHLAVGIMKALALDKGVKALFCDNRGLLKAINHSYNPAVSTTELDVLKPVFEADLLVIDELGSAKKTEWVSDIVEHIINTRYNDHRTTIITTNYVNAAAGKGVPWEADTDLREEPRAVTLPSASDNAEERLTSLDQLHRELARKNANAFSLPPLAPRLTQVTQPNLESVPAAVAKPGMKTYPRASSAETLGDRIGERMRSRLAEMCVTIKITGADYRQGPKKAEFR